MDPCELFLLPRCRLSVVEKWLYSIINLVVICMQSCTVLNIRMK